jgi:hypothetical protein
MNSISDKQASTPRETWAPIKGCLQLLDKSELIELIHTIYQGDAQIQAALTVRFFPSSKSIDQIRTHIINMIYPNPMGTRPIRASDAFKTIRKFFSISGDPSATCAMLLDGIEAGTAQAKDIGVEDETYFNALEKMIQMLMTLHAELPRQSRRVVRDRLIRIYDYGKGVGFGYDERLLEGVKTIRSKCR